MKKKIIIGLIILAVITGLFFLLRNGDPERESTVVEERELIEEVFETGTVKSGDNINLSFQSGGTIERIPVSEGQDISKGDLVASLDKQDLVNQRNKAAQQLIAAEAELESVQQGGREEEIDSLENRLEEAEESVKLAEKSLQEAEDSQETNLQNTYSGTPSLVNRAYLLSKSVKDEYKDIRDQYFVGFYLSDTYVARRAIGDIEDSYEDLRDISRSLETSSSFNQMAKGLNQAEETFTVIENSIETVIEVSEIDFYERRFTEETNQYLWDSKEKVSEMKSNIVGKKGEIESTEDSTESAITTAESNLASAKSKRNELKDNLDQMKLGGRDSQVRAAEANVEVAKEDLELANRNLQRGDLYSPASGKVSKIHYTEGEKAQAQSPVVTVLGEEQYHLEVNIYEGDIVGVEVGDPVTIELVPFSNQEFSGEVTSIQETGELIEGVVYYETKISIDNPPEKIMPEMTADTTIQTNKIEALSLPREAIRRDGSKRFVRVLEDGEEVEKDIEVGITDAYGYVEIKSGLSAGDEVLID
ncbi:MAG: efflux RND transporter periplasmic adaptor subunit [Patescibacteria group bacterium]